MMENNDTVTNVTVPKGPRTLWEFLRQGLVSSEKRPSNHRRFTHSRKPKSVRRKAKLASQASRRKNRPPKRRTGIKPKRV